MVRSAGHYEPYTTERGWIFFSGQTGEDGDRLGPDLSAQTAQAIRNIATILEEAGVSLEDVRKTTCFLANIDDLAEFDAAYARGMGTNPPAARSASWACRVEPWSRSRHGPSSSNRVPSDKNVLGPPRTNVWVRVAAWKKRRAPPHARLVAAADSEHPGTLGRSVR